MTPSRKRAQASRERRERIIAAARRCFGVNGYARTRMQDIASHAEVSTGCTYRFFKDKRELYQVVVDLVLREWKERLDDVVAAHAGDPAGALEARFRASLEYARSQPLLPVLLSQDGLRILQGSSELIEHTVGDSRAKVTRLLRAGVEQGVFRENLDVVVTADGICELGISYAVRTFHGGSPKPLDSRFVDATIKWILAGVLAH